MDTSTSNQPQGAAGTPPPPPAVPVPPPPPPQKGSLPMLSIVLALLAIAGAAVAIMYLWVPQNFFGGAVEQKEPFVIGGILPLTGDGASFGVPIQQAAELAKDEINALGGIGGQMIEIVWHDGKCESADAALAAGQLIESTKPRIMIGGACSSEVLASAPIASAAGILTLSSASTNPAISDLPDVFRTAPSDALAGKIAAQYAVQTLEAKSVAIITEDKAYPQGLREVFKAAYTASGGTIVADEVFSTGATEFQAAVSRIKAAKPDMVYILPQTPAPGVVIVKELKEQKVDADYLTAEVLLIRDAVVEQGDILEGVVGVEVLFDKENPKAGVMLASYEREYGREATYPHFMGGIYDLMYLIKEAYESTDGAKANVAAYFDNLREWQGTIGPITFDDKGDPSLPYQIIRITNNTTERIDVVVPQI